MTIEEQINQVEPILVITGTAGVNAQYFIYNEKKLSLELDTLQEAVSFLFASYYVYDMCYPKNSAPIFLFFQCCVFGITQEPTSISS